MCDLTSMKPKPKTQTACHFKWSNITKLVESKETSNGLLKSSISSGPSRKKSVDNNSGQNYAGISESSEQQKVILNQVSGEANPSQVLALMGPSGSGKTSLLDVLAARSSYNDGIVSLNGDTITKRASRIKALKRKIAYIKQQDIFFDHLTVKDQLTYTAFLRLGDNVSPDEKRQEVDKVVNLLRLEKCQDTSIRLISGGERKRCNIGTELLTEPSLILLDEPTSGLDSTSAVALMSLLGSLAHDHGKTIITSIHQPSSAMFHNFDKVLFLADGCMVYYGTPFDSLSYIRDLRYTCPDGYNAADHWMDLLVEDSALPDNAQPGLLNSSGKNCGEEEDTVGSNSENDQFPICLSIMDGNASVSKGESLSHARSDGSPKKSSIFSRKSRKNTPSPLSLAKEKRQEYKNGKTPKAQLIMAWDVDDFAEEIERDIETHNVDDVDTSSLCTAFETDASKKFNTSWMTQFRVLLHRSLKNSRSAILTPLNIVKSLCLGLIIGCLWFQMENTEKMALDRSSYMFFTVTFWIFDGTFGALFGFPAERTIIFKERASGSYHLSAYFMAKTLSELPTRLILPLMFLIISYWMSAVNPSFVVFLGTTACTLLGVLTGESIGLLIAALVMDFEKGITITTLYTLTTLMSGGFYIKNIPAFMSWTPYVSPFKYAYHSSAKIAFNSNIPCDGSGVLETICKLNVEVATPEQVREFLNIKDSIGFNVGMMLVMIFVARYLAFLALKGKKGDERG